MDGGWQDEYREDEEDEENEFEGGEPLKDQTVFLIDATEPMFADFVTSEDTGMQSSFFSYAIDMVKLFLKVKIFANPSDEFALLFYGTNKASNDSNLENVYTYLPLDLTDATRIKDLEGLQDEDFQEKIGSMTSGSADALRMGLWAAGQVLMKKSKANKQVFLITRDDQPTGTSTAARDSTIKRAEELKHAQVTLQFMPLPTPGKLFNLELFWKSLLQTANPQQGSQEDSSQASDVSSDFAYLHEFAQKESFTRDDIDAITSSDLVRKKAYRKRAVARLHWALVEGTSIAVQLYNMVQPCSKPQTITLRATDNAILRSERRLLHAETGQMLTEQDKVKVFQPDAKVSPACFPSQVRMSREAVLAVKALTEPGLKLLGFKPREVVRDYHQAGHSSFVRPNENDIKGSITAFKALLAVMVQQDKVAVCSYRRGKSSDVRLVALMAQQEVRDANGLQVFPEGMHMFQLPFMDDIRSPELEVSVVGTEIHRADVQQVAMAAELIDALTFPPDELTGVSTFDCYSVRNPFLQRAYDAIELRAMGKPIPPIEANPSWDETLPDLETMKTRSPIIQAYMDAVYGLDANPDGAKGTKRKTAAAADTGAASEAFAQHDWASLARPNGGLERLKVDELKLYLRHKKLPLSGNKADLVARIREHETGGP